ncbi:MAG: CSLREA domain-containing protein, partial [Gammaproteobacteria bacterium]|nr:CSLREA domain-containing protein [Gammaproteobacteria bacterium]
MRSAIGALLICLATVTTASAATFTVTKTADTNDGSCDADCSLHEAIVAANATGGPHTIAFSVPPADPGFTGGVAVFTMTTALPPITRNGVTVDGTTQTTNRGNTNPVTLGIGGTVGVDALPLSQVAGPEVEIRDGNGLLIGLQEQANNATIRGVAILGFGTGDGEGAIIIDNNFNGALIEENVLGSTATSFTDPGAALRNYHGVESVGGDNGTIRDNLVGFNHRGIFLSNGSTGWTVEGNEIRDHELASTDGDGIAVSGSSVNTLTGNY